MIRSYKLLKPRRFMIGLASQINIWPCRYLESANDVVEASHGLNT
jgi:hypothetical protein